MQTRIPCNCIRDAMLILRTAIDKASPLSDGGAHATDTYGDAMVSALDGAIGFLAVLAAHGSQPIDNARMTCAEIMARTEDLIRSPHPTM